MVEHMIHARQARAFILSQVGAAPRQTKRTIGAIGPLDYVPCPLPPNLNVLPHGDCLIWTGRINQQGYGTGVFPTGLKLAHQQSFAQSRGKSSSGLVLHLCARPFCIQPSHLYEGTPQENGEDARLIRGATNVPWSLLERKSLVATQVARYSWSSGQAATAPIMHDSPVNHECNDALPAGDRRMCSICNTTPGMEPINPPMQSGQAGQVDGAKRMVKDLDGYTVSVDAQYRIDRAPDRAARRRRARNRLTGPVLISSGTIDVRDGAKFRTAINPPPEVCGPGFIALMMRPLKTKTQTYRAYGPRVSALLG